MIITNLMLGDIARFRPAGDDLAEAEAAGLGNVRVHLFNHWDDKQVCVWHNRRLLALGGNNGDQCWFVMDESVESLSLAEKLTFRKLIMQHRDRLHVTYPVLWNYVWVGNKSHYRFLHSIGAVFHMEFTKSPVTGESFQLFTISRR